MTTSSSKNPFNTWNFVYIHYCDGSMFSGNADVYVSDGRQIHFKGKNIVKYVIEWL